ncbi:hypothetical protein J3A83DRAFT_4093322, partial [Scleroderma citrinum]
ITHSSSLTKGNATPSSATETASISSKRNRRATTDLSNTGSNVLNGSTLDAGLRTPRPRRSSTILVHSSTTSPQTSAKPPNRQTPSPVQSGSASSAPKVNAQGRRTKNGTLHTANGSADQSLMSIVEDVTRQNRERRLGSTQAVSVGHANPAGGELPVLEVPRAPSLQVPQATVPGMSTHDSWFGRLPNGSTRSLDLPHNRSVATPSLPVSLAMAPVTSPNAHNGSLSDSASAPAGTTMNGAGARPASRPAKSPFPSALRNASRTPSPIPIPGVNTQAANGTITEPGQPRGRSLERVLAANRASLTSDPRDSMSISSYETGRESPISSSPSPSPSPRPLSLLPQSSQTPVPRNPPVSREQVSRDHDHGGSSSTASADTPATRRKSVRVSLQPTFSPPPPASYDEFDDNAEADGRHTSWSSQPTEPRKTKRVTGDAANDVWQDSSEEDEEYSRARRLLSRMGKGKGKI